MYYLLFAGSDYYPSGGWDDFRGSFKTIEEAKAAAAEIKSYGSNVYDWYQIVDFAPTMNRMEVILTARGEYEQVGMEYIKKLQEWEDAE